MALWHYIRCRSVFLLHLSETTELGEPRLAPTVAFTEGMDTVCVYSRGHNCYSSYRTLKKWGWRKG